MKPDLSCLFHLSLPAGAIGSTVLPATPSLRSL